MEQLESTRTNKDLRWEHVDSVWTLNGILLNSVDFDGFDAYFNVHKWK